MVPPQPTGLCTALLVVRQTETRRGCAIDERVPRAPGVLRYPCAGGPATADLGASRFSGSVQAGVVDLRLRTAFRFTDPCDWESVQAISGNLGNGGAHVRPQRVADAGPGALRRRMPRAWQRDGAAAALGDAEGRAAGVTGAPRGIGHPRGSGPTRRSPSPDWRWKAPMSQRPPAGRCPTALVGGERARVGGALRGGDGVDGDARRGPAHRRREPAVAAHRVERDRDAHLVGDLRIAHEGRTARAAEDVMPGGLEPIGGPTGHRRRHGFARVYR